MEWWGIVCAFGIPSIILGFLLKKISTLMKEIKAVKLGTQAMLRAEMINDYNHYKGKGFAPIYAKENFENCYLQYHSLGANGVMDGIHTEFLTLSTEGDTT